jgi:hypothetical protein
LERLTFLPHFCLISKKTGQNEHHRKEPPSQGERSQL